MVTNLGERGKASSTPSDPRVEPAQLASIRRQIRTAIPETYDELDRRGFRLLHWDAPRQTGKPIELSLEHEARYSAPADAHLGRLLPNLYASHGRTLGEWLLPGAHAFADHVITQFERPPGAQSVDLYYDTAAEGEAGGSIAQLVTLRERRTGSSFMSWNAGEGAVRPLNLELPFITLDAHGMTARLEFNWIDDLEASRQEALGVNGSTLQARNPLHIASELTGKPLATAVPAVEHATVRHKFRISAPSSGDATGEEAFALNVDIVVARTVRTDRRATVVHLDISSVKVIDDLEIDRLTQFARLWADTYDLAPNLRTNPLEDYGALGVTPPDIATPEALLPATPSAAPD